MKGYDSDYDQRTSRETLAFIIKNIKYLKPADLQTAQSLSANKEPFTPNQISLIKNTLYEKVMEGAGYESCGTKHDFAKKRIRY